MNNKPVLTIVSVLVVIVVGFGVGASYAKRVRQAAAEPKAPAVVVEPSAVNQAAVYSLFLVAFGDNGDSGKLVGCGDSLVPVGTSATTPKTALEALLNIKTQAYGESGLSTALYSSALTVGVVTSTRIDLFGTTSLGGSCDVPRFQEQLEATARQFPGYEQVALYVNGKTLKEALSLK